MRGLVLLDPADRVGEADIRRRELVLDFQRRTGPGLLDELDAFLDPLAAVFHLDAEGIELVHDRSRGRGQNRAGLATADQSGGLLRHPHRIVERQNRGAELHPDALGARHQVGREHRPLAEEQAAVAHEMVLDQPDIVDPDALARIRPAR